ncbi:ribonuclease HII [Bifidobacterium parmae]|uniref:Ribonuclease n=1 Tax=Bifidobacterium parmae TaxID=361854 RepID=A0A2N5J0B2_9BIFI|nr:ribonuclease HII [Bifidobacterium parmae]PLS27649.1 ribonuclease HII [Bifidobacterium parmae]
MITPTLDLERELASRGYDLIAGFDEVGRGALAGPAMVGCAIIRARDLTGERTGDAGADGAGPVSALAVPAGVADSKLLTERRREAIYDELTGWAAAWAVGAASNAEIDEWGIGHALGVAALRALAEAESKLGLDAPGVSAASNATNAAGERRVRVGAILDGPYDYITKALNTFDAPDVPVPADVTTKVKGDRSCATVATAAVIAKVTRDRLMERLAERPEYAAYQWAHNKGYGTAVHKAAIAAQGPCDLHRVSWKLV